MTASTISILKAYNSNYHMNLNYKRRDPIVVHAYRSFNDRCALVAPSRLRAGGDEEFLVTFVSHKSDTGDIDTFEYTATLRLGGRYRRKGTVFDKMYL